MCHSIDPGNIRMSLWSCSFYKVAVDHELKSQIYMEFEKTGYFLSTSVRYLPYKYLYLDRYCSKLPKSLSWVSYLI